MTEVDLAGKNSELQVCGHKRQYEASWGDAESSHCSLCMVLRLHEQNRGLESNNARLREALEKSKRKLYFMDSSQKDVYEFAAKVLSETPPESLAAIRAEAKAEVESLKQQLAEARSQRDLAQQFQAEIWKVTTPCEPDQAVRTIQTAAKAEEREACAKIADDACCLDPNCYECDGVGIADTIRARGDAGERG